MLILEIPAGLESYFNEITQSYPNEITLSHNKNFSGGREIVEVRYLICCIEPQPRA